MPSRARAATSLSSFVLDALQTTLTARETFTKTLSRQVATVTVRNTAGYLVSVIVDELLDTTMADTLSAFGDVHAEKPERRCSSKGRR
jgi:hypothetical protein